MNLFRQILEGVDFTNDLRKDINKILLKYNRKIIAKHSMEVGDECIRLAKLFGEDEKKAEIAGVLHDIGGIYAFSERLEASRNLGLEILKEEEELPLILHQKISKIMAREIWKIDDEEILSAISCHTTLKKDPSKLDLILFVSDKIKWDQIGEPPYLHRVQAGLEISLEKAAYEYIAYMMENKEKIKVIHPWLRDAYEYLSKIG